MNNNIYSCYLNSYLRLFVTLAGLPAMLRTCPQRWRIAPAGRVALQAGLLWFGVLVSRADTHYVATNALSISPYTNWSDAASNIQWAIDAAANSDTVLVSNGVYETGGMTNYPSGTVLTNRVAITKAITVRSVNGPTLTIIKGAGPNGPAAVRCVYMANEYNSLVGFTVTNGATLATGTEDQRGGGVFCAEAKVILSNCVIAGNSAGFIGGGMMWGTLYNCTIVGNSATYGGGAADSIMYNCILTNNSSSYGGGVHSSDTLSNCTLTGNSSGFGAGANESTLYNCILANNRAAHGGGVYQSTLYNCLLAGNSTSGGNGGGAGTASLLYNCTIVGNSVEGAGSGGGTYQSAHYNCIVYFNGGNYSGGGFTNSCTTPMPSGQGNITNDPMFIANGSGYGTNHVAGNYRLAANSPCINTGTNQSWMTGAVDLDRRTRIRYGTVDMGAYEYIYKGSIYTVH